MILAHANRANYAKNKSDEFMFHTDLCETKIRDERTSRYSRDLREKTRNQVNQKQKVSKNWTLFTRKRIL